MNADDRFDRASGLVRTAHRLVVQTDYQPIVADRIPVLYCVCEYPKARTFDPIVFLGGAQAGRRAQ